VKIAVVTSQFPVEGDPSRGRPILQTLEALSQVARVEVFVPNARYPRWLAPRSYRYVGPAAGTTTVHGMAVTHACYSTMPIIGRLLNGYGVYRAVRRPVRDFAPDVVLSYWLYPDAYGAALIAGELGVPLVAGARGSDLRARDRISLWLTGRALRRARRLLTVSDDLKRIAVSGYGLSPATVTTIANGCNTAIFHPGDRPAERIARGIAPDARLLLYVGRLVPAKGLRELMAAWQRLAAADPQLHIAFIGDGALRTELEGEARRSGMGERVHLPGTADAGQVAGWMRACDVFCLPSYTEGYPNVLVEALACGRPVVATPVGGIVEIVDEGNGLFVPPRDVAALADGLARALRQPWDEAALSRRFMRSWTDVARETLEACEAARRP
jgi:teichuronic acid biosynthesis glycosyltransferase TuaC